MEAPKFIQTNSPSKAQSTRKPAKEFARVADVLNQLTLNLGLDRRLREHALMELWPTLAGDIFAKCSRPLFIDSASNLVVSVKDASVGQELSLTKRNLLPSLQRAAATLGLKINGIRLDLKSYHQVAND